MALRPLPTVDTRPFFRAASRALIDDVLSRLSSEAWTRPTVAGSWTVRDVVAHLADTALRRVSLQRDHHAPPWSSPAPGGKDTDVLSLVNDLNRQWVAASQRLSHRVLLDVYDLAATELADLVESIPLGAAPLFPVSWAGDDALLGWLDIGREFTEVWHHHAQIREAVGAPPSAEPAWLHAVLEVGLRAWPPACREVDAVAGATVVLDVSGEGGGIWTLLRADAGWTLRGGEPDGSPTTTVRLSDETAWRVLFSGLRPPAIASRVAISGDPSLGEPFLRIRALVV